MIETYPISHSVLQHARQCLTAARPLLVRITCLSCLNRTVAASLAHASMQQEVSTWPASFWSPLPPRPPSRSRLPGQASGPGCLQWPRAPLLSPQAPPPPAASSCCRPGQSALSELPSWHSSLSLRTNILPVTSHTTPIRCCTPVRFCACEDQQTPEVSGVQHNKLR